MKIKINNKQEAIPREMSVYELLEYKSIKSKVSVWVNGRQLLHEEYSEYIIKDSDELKILRIIGGG